MQLLSCGQVGFGRVLFDHWITAGGYLVVVGMTESRFDEATVAELSSTDASFSWEQQSG